MPNDNVFSNISIVPLRGPRTATVTWTLHPAYQDGDVHVYYSDHGVSGSWKMLNEAPVDGAVGMYEDTTFNVKNGIDVGYYRLLLIHGSDKIPSEPIGILNNISRKDYGVIQKIMRREYLAFRSRDGIPMWHCIPKTSGVLSDKVDGETGQTHGVDCPDVFPGDDSYGMKYKGGFYKPMLTWVRPIRMDFGTVRDLPDGDGIEDSAAWSVRLMAFPRPKRGHMFVDPDTDNRYVVGEEIQPYALGGKYPVAYEARLLQLDRNDPRYRFPVEPVKIEELRNTPK